MMVASRKARTRVRVCSLLAIAVPLGFLPSALSAETLSEAIDAALATNPELRAIASNRNAIDMELNAARGLYLPALDAHASTARHSDKQRLAVGVSNSDTYNARGAGFALVQRLFDGFETRHEVARQGHRVTSAQHRVADTANSIALRAVQAYLEVQRAGHVRDVAKRNLRALKDLQERVNLRVSSGKGSGADDSEAAARVANGVALLAEAEARVRDGEALYIAVIGHPPRNLQAATPPRQSLPHSLDGALGQAREFAPSILATEADTLAAKAAIGTAYARFMPNVNLEVTGDRYWGGPSYDVDYKSNIAGMLVVRMNLFNGGIDKARIYEYTARAEESRNVALNTQRAVEREVRVSWSALTSAEERRVALARQRDNNLKTKSVYNQQFDAGQRRLLDLLEVQNEIFVAEASLATEELSARYHVYRVLAAIGKLVTATGHELPEEATRQAARSLIDGWRDVKIKVSRPHADLFDRGPRHAAHEQTAQGSIKDDKPRE